MSRLIFVFFIAVFLTACGGETTPTESANQIDKSAQGQSKVKKMPTENLPKLPESAPIEQGTSTGDFTATPATEEQGILEYEYFIEFTDEVNDAKSSAAKTILEELMANYVFYLDKDKIGKVKAEEGKNQIADFSDTHPCVVKFKTGPRPEGRTNFEVVQVRLIEKNGKIYPNIGASAPIKSQRGVWDKKINFGQIKVCQNKVQNCEGESAKLAQNLMRAIFGVAYR